MKFKILDFTISHTEKVEFPLPFYFSNPKEHINVIAGKNDISVLKVGDYITVGFVYKNISNEEIENIEREMIKVCEAEDVVFQDKECYHIRTMDNGDTWHGFCILGGDR